MVSLPCSTYCAHKNDSLCCLVRVSVKAEKVECFCTKVLNSTSVAFILPNETSSIKMVSTSEGGTQFWKFKIQRQILPAQ